MIRITTPDHQRRFRAGDPATAGGQEIVLDYCAVKFIELSLIGSDIYAHGARVTVVWGRKSADGSFVEAEPLIYEEFSLANLAEQKRMEFFQRALVGEGSALPAGSPEGSPTTTIEQHEVVMRPADHALRDLLTAQPGQTNRRFGDVRMRDFEQWLVDSGKIGGVVE